MTSHATIPPPKEDYRSGKFGSFTGTVQCEWKRQPEADRFVVLLQPFSYTDLDNQIWNVPQGETVDGASIPKWLWPIIGAPYVGNYREASVIHDYYCLAKARAQYDPTDVHQMFYWASRAGGVSWSRAHVMHCAVHWFGPHWEGEQDYGSRAGHYARQLLPHTLIKRLWHYLSSL